MNKELIIYIWMCFFTRLFSAFLCLSFLCLTFHLSLSICQTILLYVFTLKEELRENKLAFTNTRQILKNSSLHAFTWYNTEQVKKKHSLSRTPVTFSSPHLLSPQNSSPFTTTVHKDISETFLLLSFPPAAFSSFSQTLAVSYLFSASFPRNLQSA